MVGAWARACTSQEIKRATWNPISHLFGSPHRLEAGLQLPHHPKTTQFIIHLRRLPTPNEPHDAEKYDLRPASSRCDHLAYLLNIFPNPTTLTVAQRTARKAHPSLFPCPTATHQKA